LIDENGLDGQLAYSLCWSFNSFQKAIMKFLILMFQQFRIK
jgi:hypothetical protein